VTLAAIAAAVVEFEAERGRAVAHVELGADAMAEVMAESRGMSVVMERDRALVRVAGPSGPLNLAHNDRLCDHMIVVDTTGERWPT